MSIRDTEPYTIYSVSGMYGRPKVDTMQKFKTIVVDPPWKYGKWGKANPKSRPNGIDYNLPYDYMTIDEIKGLPIRNLADDNCELYLWTTQKYLPIAFDVLRVWGFKYCQTLTWCKKPRGTGQGGVYCPTNEFIYLEGVEKCQKLQE